MRWSLFSSSAGHVQTASAVSSEMVVAMAMEEESSTEAAPAIVAKTGMAEIRRCGERVR